MVSWKLSIVIEWKLAECLFLYLYQFLLQTANSSQIRILQILDDSKPNPHLTPVIDQE